jgi:hypothetical protein
VTLYCSRTLGGIDHACEHADSRRLASSVRTQKPEDLALVDPKLHVVHRNQVTKLTCQTSSFDNGFHLQSVFLPNVKITSGGFNAKVFQKAEKALRQKIFETRILLAV